MDAANILKPALARGDLQCIGATTADEYKKHFEKDAALARRFQPVQVGEPNEEDAVSILFGLRDRYEAFHKARITDEAVRASVKLSARYISDRYLPDKAIDVMDEATARVRMKVYAPSHELQVLEQKLADIKKEKKRPSMEKTLKNARPCAMPVKKSLRKFRPSRRKRSSMTMKNSS